jgi:hypothetical protein
MSKLITDLTPQQRCPQTNISPFFKLRTQWCATLAVFLVTQVFSFAAVTNADEFYSQNFVPSGTEYYQPNQTFASYQTLPTVSPQQTNTQTYTSSASSSKSVQPGLAQQKAARAARSRIRGHLGGSLGGAKYEGVGWSNHSAQNAISSCCYWGTRPTAQIGVSKGNDGFWYACVLYY